MAPYSLLSFGKPQLYKSQALPFTYGQYVHYKKYTPCLGINRGSSLFIGISYGADPNI